jgi:hypothetical protein
LVPIHNPAILGAKKRNTSLREYFFLDGQYGLESYAIFIDLVKAFDTVHHDLICAILEKYGMLTTLFKNIAKLYKNCTVKNKNGKEYAEIDYTTSVHQGDNMPPVLFLFVI